MKESEEGEQRNMTRQEDEEEKMTVRFENNKDKQI